MSKKRLASLTTLFLVFVSAAVTAQEDDLGTEVVNIVKPYTPTISDAFKVKETPVLNDSLTTQKQQVNYSIFSVPVASTFTPAKGKAATVEKAKPMKLYDNYATLGFGNYTSILAELYSNFEISRTDNAGFFFRHNSSQGDIEGVLLENKYYDTSLDGNYTSRQRDASYSIDAGIKHQLFNWYGLPEFAEEELILLNESLDVQQTYFSGNLGGSMQLDDSFFEGIAANVRFLSDAYGSSEFNFTALPEFSFPLTEFTLKIDGDVDYLSGSFERNYFAEIPIDYSFLNVGLAPSLVYVNNDLTLSLGVAGYVSLDSENSETNFSIFPRINASYRLVDELLIVYGGAEGGVEQNSYYDFKEENPYVSPTLQIMPTNNLYNAFGGLKGKLSNSVGYNVRGSYGKAENRALFQINPLNDVSPSESYQYGNSFKIVYDDINTLSFFGELKVEVSEVFSLGINGEYFSYNTTDQAHAWNLPDFKATVFSNFNITEELYGGVSLFYVGERMDQVVAYSPDIDPFPTEVTLDGYADVNVHVGYRVNDRLSIFAKGSNLLSDNYQKSYNYPVQGIQGLLGATYKFDW
ncbi:hypothetical protein ATE92_1795 [Ulvibacter sp. MAR_2010_11]|uniref:TonB-dependent receptor n=1 Tax=Ulvibacter sp. MAR_2010_11 TaxID=1250229 RepID=UPI000C2CC4D0|nr:TonB-dependent receptor [Ulvibacter sp. MAR_2010_11]PKA83635.1 hypothetical protein ATE92_1795 [Ulvibacter sp. MAR_2010_11]